MFGIPMKWVSLIMLVTQTVGVVFAMRLSRTRPGTKYLNTTAVFFSEVLKVICSFIFLCREEQSIGDAAQQVKRHLTSNPVETLKVCVPGLLYTVQNNLLFIALSHLSGAVYQVTYQLKILTTAVLTVLILGKTLGAVKWSALSMLTVGVILIQLPRGGQPTVSPSSESSSTAVGLAAVLSACVTSGLAGVYLEKILKQTEASIWLRNIQLGVFGTIMGFGACLSTDYAQIVESGFLQGYDGLVCGVILLQAVGGLIVAAVLKYADNILKCFGSALSIVISCVLSGVILEEFEPDFLFVVGTVLVMQATALYSLGIPDSVLAVWTRKGLKSNEASIQMEMSKSGP